MPIPVQHNTTITTKTLQQSTTAFKLILPSHQTPPTVSSKHLRLSTSLTATTMPPIPWWVHSSASSQRSSISPRTHLTTSLPPTDPYSHVLETFLEVLIVIFCVLSLSYSIYLSICFVTWALQLAGYELHPRLSLRARYSSREHVTRHWQKGTYSDDVEAVEMPGWAKVTNRTARSWTW
jgi:hypothetical protein